jgi:hypothetical protein
MHVSVALSDDELELTFSAGVELMGSAVLNE